MSEKQARKGSDRRKTDRRKENLPIAIEERRDAQRRSGKDRRSKSPG